VLLYVTPLVNCKLPQYSRSPIASLSFQNVRQILLQSRHFRLIRHRIYIHLLDWDKVKNYELHTLYKQQQGQTYEGENSSSVQDFTTVIAEIVVF
jgi:hypothetical protein